MRPDNPPDPTSFDPTSFDSEFVDGVMARVRESRLAEDSEELFPALPSGTSVWGGAPRPSATDGARARSDRLTRLAFVVAAAICLAVRVSLLGSMLAGEPLDDMPSTASRSVEEVADDV